MTAEAVPTGAMGSMVEDRVTMKLDVAHTEHSHLIGKGGHCVKAMMLETQCHIHFPDSNRVPNVVEKSNQVSISGQLADVERARRRIRQMLPLSYLFTIQNSSPHALTLYRTSCMVQHIEAKFSVEVTYRHYFAFPLADLTFRHHPHAKYLASATTIVVSVRGLAHFAHNVIEATKALLEHHFGRMAEQTNVWMTLDVEPKHQIIMQHHIAQRSLAEVIHESTGARVWFPQETSFPIAATSAITTLSPCPSPLSISPRRSGFYAPRLCPTPSLPVSSVSLFQRPEARTMITIFGSVNGCFVARQTLMTLLPVTLIAEITGEEALILSRIDYNAYKSLNDVSVTFRAKPRHSFRQSLVLKTYEANVNSLYSVLSNLKMVMRSRVEKNSPNYCDGQAVRFTSKPFNMSEDDKKLTEKVTECRMGRAVISPAGIFLLVQAEYKVENRCLPLIEEIQNGVTTLPPLEAFMPPTSKEQEVETELEKVASLRRQRSRYPFLSQSFAIWSGESRSPSPNLSTLQPHISLESGGMTFLGSDPATANCEALFNDSVISENCEPKGLLKCGQSGSVPISEEPMWPKLSTLWQQRESQGTQEETLLSSPADQCGTTDLPSWYSTRNLCSGLFLNPWNDKSRGNTDFLR
ncbi:unnamed protein product [Hydatigera taeniaeformis]|uniref:K Homology domain-containing protein n=1 Tax=Hydatigena taeniaeformis TaxID=6205 RepID=A0A3P7G792_HYDTA|nr:unnamed protein product [Hydatigera taeniaeformis]